MGLKSFAAAVLVAGVTAGLSSAARAEVANSSPIVAPITEYGSAYLSIGAGGEVHNLPRFNLGTLTNGSSFFSVNPSLVTGNGYGTFGFRLDRTGTPAWMGNKPRIEVNLGFAQGSLRESQAGPQAAMPLVAIDGVTTGFFAAANWDTRLRMQYLGFDGAIRAKTDFQVGKNLTLTPSLAFLGGFSSTDFYVTRQQNLPFAGVSARNHKLVEHLKTTRLGGEAAVDVTWKPKPRWQLHAGISAAGLHQRTSFSGRDCFVGAPGSGNDCAPVTAVVSATDTASHGAFNLGLRAGTTYDFGWFKVSLIGHGTWQSAVPGIRNPDCTASGAGAAPVCTATNGPARIVHSSQWKYGGLVFVTIPIQ